MDENDVRSSASAFGDALVAGDVDAAIGHLSDELKRNVGEVVALLPLPATEAEIMSLDRAAGAAAAVAVLRIVGETSEVEIQTRWKDRDGQPRIVEVSHLSRVEREAPAAEEGAEESESPAEAGEGRASP